MSKTLRERLSDSVGKRNSEEGKIAGEKVITKEDKGKLKKSRNKSKENSKINTSQIPRKDNKSKLSIDNKSRSSRESSKLRKNSESPSKNVNLEEKKNSKNQSKNQSKE